MTRRERLVWSVVIGGLVCLWSGVVFAQTAPPAESGRIRVVVHEAKRDADLTVMLRKSELGEWEPEQYFWKTAAQGVHATAGEATGQSLDGLVAALGDPAGEWSVVELSFVQVRTSAATPAGALNEGLAALALLLAPVTP